MESQLDIVVEDLNCEENIQCADEIIDDADPHGNDHRVQIKDSDMNDTTANTFGLEATDLQQNTIIEDKDEQENQKQQTQSDNGDGKLEFREGITHHLGNSVLVNSTPSWQSDAVLAVKIWMGILMRSMKTIFVASFVMTLYYLPALISNGMLSELTSSILYWVLRIIGIQLLTYSVCICIFIRIFSFAVALRGILLISAPCFAFAMFLIILGLCFPNLWFIIGFLLITVGIMMVFAIYYYAYKRVIVKFNSKEEKVGYGLTKDGTPQALAKGWIVFSFALFLFSNGIYPYLEASQATQIFIRSLILPFVIFLVSFSQYLTMVGLSFEHMDRRLIVASCTNMAMQYLGRLMVSNFSDNPLSVEFLIMNGSLGIVELCSRVSYSHRYVAYKKIKHKLGYGMNNMIDAARKHSRRIFSIQVVPGEDIQTRSIPLFKIPAHTSEVRAKSVIEDMTIEILVIFTVPLLMYLLHPIAKGSMFLTIPTIQECITQILVQLVFEFFVDCIAIFVEIHYLSLPMEVPEPLSGEVQRIQILMSGFCLIYISHIIFEN